MAFVKLWFKTNHPKYTKGVIAAVAVWKGLTKFKIMPQRKCSGVQNPPL